MTCGKVCATACGRGSATACGGVCATGYAAPNQRTM
jgi:hypothetical protein